MASLRQQMREYEKALIEKSLEENNGNQSHTALALGISRRTLLNKIKLHLIGAEAKPVPPVEPPPTTPEPTDPTDPTEPTED